MDNLTVEQRSYTMSRIRSTETELEKAVRSVLHRRGFRFRKNVKNLPGTPDIVLPRYRTIVLINGCFWHRHANCSRAVFPKSNPRYWKPKLQSNMKRDEKRLIALRALGWKVITIWGCEIEKGCERVVHRKVVAKLIRR